MKRSSSAAVIVAALIVGGCGQKQSPNRSSDFANRSVPSKRQAEQKFGAKPGVTEYRVHSDLILALGKGVSGSVNGNSGDYSSKCVNGNGGFPFNTATDQETHDLWIDASEAVVPPCFQAASYQYFTVNIYGPYKGKMNNVRLGQDQAGNPYELECGSPGPDGRLACRKKGPLTVEITCVDKSPPQPPCVVERGKSSGRK